MSINANINEKQVMGHCDICEKDKLIPESFIENGICYECWERDYCK